MKHHEPMPSMTADSLEPTTLVDLVRRRAATEPKKRAYTFLLDGDSDEASFSCAQLDRAARAVAALLQSRGIVKGDRALLLYPASLDYVAAFFGCLYAGVLAVPAYPPRPRRRSSRLEAIAADAQAAVALTIAPIASGEEYQEHRANSPAMNWLATDALDLSLAEAWKPPSLSDESLAFLQYTSGSTSSPKGVMVSHGNLIYNERMIELAFRHTDQSTFVGWLPMFHDMGLIGNLIQPLYIGAHSVLMSPMAFLQEPVRWLRAISRYKARTSGAPNFAYDLCVQKITAEQRASLDLRSWDLAFNGAEPVRHDTLDRFASAFQSCGFRREAFYPCYGLAEATLLVSGGEKGKAPVVGWFQAAALEQGKVVRTVESDPGKRAIVSCGTTWLGQQIVIADPDKGTRCRPDRVGEIWIAGPNVTGGYWNLPEQSAESCRACLADTNEGPFLRTGDLGFFQDGELFVTGRLKDLIIIRGRNLSPHDIEHTVESSHPILRPGCGAAFSIDVAGEERLVVVQEVARQFRQTDLEEVVDAIREATFDEHEVQAYAVALIKPGSIPKTSSGKIQRRASRQEYLSGGLEVLKSSILEEEGSLETADIAERTKAAGGPWGLMQRALTALGADQCQAVLESHLRDRVAQALRVAPSKVDPGRPLSYLGLDSLRAIELQHAIEVELGVVVSMATVLEAPSISQLAADLASRLTGAVAPGPTVSKPDPPASAGPSGFRVPTDVMVLRQSAIKPVSREDRIALSFAQERLWFLDQLEGPSATYNISAAFCFSGSLDVAALGHTLAEIVRRHESLRTSFPIVDDSPAQVITPTATVSLPVVNLQQLAYEDSAAELERLATLEARRPFSLSEQRLLRTTLVSLNEQECVLLVTMHHIVSDGWSVGLFIREMAELYEAYSQGTPSPLTDLPIQYADFSDWQRRWLHGDVLKDQLDYWKRQLAGAPALLELPTDRPRPAVQSFRGGTVRFDIGSKLTEELKRLGRQSGKTLYMTVQAAFATLLFRYSGQKDIVLGCPIANRNRAGVESLIGFFANTLVERIDLSGNPTFLELLERVRRANVGGYQHQDVPFEHLVEALQPSRSLSHNPLFQVMFVFQNVPHREIELPRVALSGLKRASGTAKFDLLLALEESADGLHGELEYSTDLFEHSRIARMADHFRTLLEEIVANPQRNIAALNLLTEAERHEVRTAASHVPHDEPDASCVHQRFESRVQQTPDEVAVTHDDARLTYRDLNARSNKLAHYLRSLEIGPEVRVGVCLERPSEMLIALLGILKAGGAFVVLEPTLPRNRLRLMLDEMSLRVLLSRQHLAEVLPEHPGVPVVCLDSERESIDRQSPENPIHQVTPESLAHVAYRWRHPVLVDHRGLGDRLHRRKSGSALSDPDAVWPTGDLDLDAAGLEHLAALDLGHPANQSLCVLDSHLQPVPKGIDGEVCVAGAGLPRGYLQDPVAEAQHFVPSPTGGRPGARLFRTEALGRVLENGGVEIVRPPRGEVRINDCRVDLREVEAALIDEPSVIECTVLAKDSETSERRLVAYVVASDSYSPERLQKHLLGRLPSYMVPGDYVPLNRIPLTAGGTVDEAALNSLAVMDASLVRRWEERLGQFPEIRDVAVVMDDAAEPPRPLHLSDLLSKPEPPEPTTHPAADRDSTDATRERAATTNVTPALSDGGPLSVAPDAPRTLVEALLRTATTHAAKGLRYVASDGSESFQSYGALLAEARCILTGLLQQGLTSGDVAILQIQDLRDHFAVFWGCVLGGIIPVTVTVPPTYDEKNAVVSKLLNTWELLARPPVVASDALKRSIGGLQAHLPSGQLDLSYVGDLRRNVEAEHIRQAAPEDVAFFQLTSGSTGVPKCIQETHKGIIRHIHGATQFNDYSPDDVSLNWLPMDHVVPILTCHLKDVYLGCEQVAVTTDAVLANPLIWLDLIDAHRVTHTWSPNFGYKLVNHAFSKSAGRKWDLSSVKYFMNAGEQVTWPVVHEFLQLLAPSKLAPGAMQPAFGMAEVCTCMTYQSRFEPESCVHRVDKASLGGQITFAANGSANTLELVDLGGPVPGVQIRIVDRDNRLLPERVIGRLQIKGDVVTPGYVNNTSANDEAFVGDGWFNSGDMGFIFDGRLTLTGREKEIIIIRGANYYCHEIEDVVQQVDGVEPGYVAACGYDCPETGTENLAIFFTPAAGGLEENVHLIEQIRSKVASSVGINPSVVVPVSRNSFPKTTSGKIQRTKLKTSLLKGDFEAVQREIDIQLGRQNTLPSWFYRIAWRRQEPAVPPTRLKPGPYLVLLDAPGLGIHVCRRLEQAGERCVQVEKGPEFKHLGGARYRIHPGNREHYDRLLESLDEDGIPIRQVLHLGTYDADAGEISSVEQLETAQDDGLYSLLFLIQALHHTRRPNDPLGLQVISSHTQSVHEGDTIAFEKTTLLGLLKTAAQELPWIACRHLDLPVDRIDANARRILRELDVSARESEVACRHTVRWVPRLERADLPGGGERELPFKVGGVYLMSGGLGDIGTELAKHLLEHFRARLLVVGRTSLDEGRTQSDGMTQHDVVSQRRRAYEELKQLGGEVVYESVDVADLDALQYLVERTQARWGARLDGIIHLAGALHERTLVDETRESFAASLRAKVSGTWALHQLLQHAPDAWFVGFSSVNGFFGGVAAGAYAAANSFVEGFCRHQQGKKGPRIRCFSWTMWDDLGMSRGSPDQVKTMLRARGYYAIRPEQGLSSFLAGMCGSASHLIVGLDETKSPIRQLVAAVPHDRRKLIAYFTLEDGARPPQTLDDLVVSDRFQTRSACAFVQVPELPLTETGTIDKARLIGKPHALRGSEEQLAPRTEAERELARIWQEVLDLPRVGIRENFFQLGGQSILATQVMSRVRSFFRIDLPVRDLFESPTIERLAERIEACGHEGSAREAPPIERADRTSELPPSFAQERLWFLEQMDPGSRLYESSVGYHVRGRLNVEALRKAFGEILRRHEILRTSFPNVRGRPVQVVAPGGEMIMPLVDLRGMPPAVRERHLQGMASRMSDRPLDLECGPLLRAALLRVGETEHLLLFDIHHIVSDGWSVGVLSGELSRLYGAYCQGRPSPLNELPIQYADYAAWQRKWLQGDVLDAQLSYWRSRLGGRLPVLTFKTDRPRPAVETLRAADELLPIDSGLTRRLKSLSAGEDVTLFMTLVAAYKTLLHRLSGEADVVVGTDWAGRDRLELEELIGFFVNLLVLRTDLSGNPDFRTLLRRVRETAMGAMAHRDMPFDRLVAELQPARHHSRTPLFQALFVFENVPTEPLRLAGLEFTPLPNPSSVARFDLALFVREEDGGLITKWTHNTDRFDARTVRDMAAHFRTLLGNIAAQPDARLHDLEIRTEDEIHQQALEEKHHREDRLAQLARGRRRVRKPPASS